MNEQTTEEKIKELRAKRDALNRLMGTDESERRNHNYAQRDYLDDRIEALLGRPE